MKNHVNEKTLGKIYFFTDLQYIKIGFTTEELDRRLERLQTGSSQRLYNIGYITGTIDIEEELHKRFAYCLYRENSEWFTLDEHLINFINERTEGNSYIELQNERLFIYASTKNIRSK